MCGCHHFPFLVIYLASLAKGSWRKDLVLARHHDLCGPGQTLTLIAEKGPSPVVTIGEPNKSRPRYEVRWGPWKALQKMWKGCAQCHPSDGSFVRWGVGNKWAMAAIRFCVLRSVRMAGTPKSEH